MTAKRIWTIRNSRMITLNWSSVVTGIYAEQSAATGQPAHSLGPRHPIAIFAELVKDPGIGCQRTCNAGSHDRNSNNTRPVRLHCRCRDVRWCATIKDLD